MKLCVHECKWGKEGARACNDQGGGGTQTQTYLRYLVLFLRLSRLAFAKSILLQCLCSQEGRPDSKDHRLSALVVKNKTIWNYLPRFSWTVAGEQEILAERMEFNT